MDRLARYSALLLLLVIPACGDGGGNSIAPPGAFALTAPAAGATVPANTSLTWDASPGAASYTLEIATDAGFTTLAYTHSGITTTTDAPPTPLTGFTFYYWRVTADNAGGSVTASNAPQTFTTGPHFPGGFTLLLPTAGETGVVRQPSFSWTPSEYATTYSLDLSLVPDFSSFVLQKTGLTRTTFIPDTPLAEGTPFYWRVTAVNVAASVPDTAGAWSFTTAPTPSISYNAVLNVTTDTRPVYFGSLNPVTYAFTKLNGEGLEGFLGIEALTLDGAGDNLWAFDRSSHQLLRISTSTGIPTALGFTNYQGIYALAYDPSADKLYATDDNTFQLLTLNKSTGVGTPVGSLGFGLVHGLAWDGTGTLYGTDVGTDKLLTINTTTGAGTAVGDLGFPMVEGIAYDTFRNRLVGADQFSENLLSINKSTGQATVLGSIGSVSFVTDIAYDPFADTVYAFQFGQILSLNPSNAQTQRVRTTGYYGANGMTFDPVTNRFYAVRSGGIDELFVIDPDTGVGRTIGTLSNSHISSIAIDPVTGTLYVADTFGGTLFTVDSLTAQLTVVGSIGALGSQRLVGMVWDAASGTLLASDDFADVLVRVNPATAATTTIGSFGPGMEIGALALDPTAGVLYGSGPGGLCRISLRTGAATTVGGGGTGLTGLTYHPTQHVLYAMAFTPNSTLCRIHPWTGQATTVNATGASQVHALAYDPYTKIVYGVYSGSASTNYLVRFNPANGQATVIGSIGSIDIQAIAFDPATRSLYGSDNTFNRLITINPGTGKATPIGTMNVSPVRALAFHPVSHQLYGVANGTSQLITINTATAQATAIGAVGALGFFDVAGITVDPGTMTLYGVDQTNRKIISINPTTGVGALLADSPVGFGDIIFR